MKFMIFAFENSSNYLFSASSHMTSSATTSIELPEISLSRERPQPPHRLLTTTPRIIPLERVPPSASESPAKIARAPQPPANEQAEKATKRDRLEFLSSFYYDMLKYTSF